MRRRPAALAVPLAIALFAATPAYANHTDVGSSVIVRHGATTVASYISDPALVPCSGTVCSNTVPLNNRDYSRFLRWCGADSQVVNIPSGSVNPAVICQGPSSWTLRVSSALNDCSSGTNCVPTTHPDADVQVTVHAVRGGSPF
jgi:hypothetical protein